MGRLIDLTGQTFGRLKVIKRNGTGSTGQAQWLCECECGKTTTVLSDNLKRGKQVSCGCYNKEIHTTHGHTKGYRSSVEYVAWLEMKRRCTDEKYVNYNDYGGRGITYCERWNAFENFFEDMGKRPSRHHSLDRIRVNGNYEPSNCRWATASVQASNQRIKSTNKSGHKGVSWEKRREKWVATITINYKQMNLGAFDNIEEAIDARKKAEKKYHRPS